MKVNFLLALLCWVAAGDSSVNDLEGENGEEVAGAFNIQQLEQAGQDPRMYQRVIQAMRRPGVSKDLGQVLPILRVMTPAQRLALAAMLATPGKMSLQQATSMLGAERRQGAAAELLLPISWDIAHILKGADNATPEAKELRQLHYQNLPRRTPPGVNRRNALVTTEMLPPPAPPRLKPRHPAASPAAAPAADSCEYFSSAVCLQDSNYPKAAILASIERQPETLQALLVDHRQEAALAEQNRRGDKNVVQQEEGLCQSRVRFARPQRARATSGLWKFVVNVADYTQTLRMEMCMKPKESCNILPASIDSHCEQVYNYQRLLTWDETKGLHMDIFKVPTCCACQVKGYNQKFLTDGYLQSSAQNPSNSFELDFDPEDEVGEEDDDDGIRPLNRYAPSYVSKEDPKKQQRHTTARPTFHQDLPRPSIQIEQTAKPSVVNQNIPTKRPSVSKPSETIRRPGFHSRPDQKPSSTDIRQNLEISHPPQRRPSTQGHRLPYNPGFAASEQGGNFAEPPPNYLPDSNPIDQGVIEIAGTVEDVDLHYDPDHRPPRIGVAVRPPPLHPAPVRPPPQSSPIRPPPPPHNPQSRPSQPQPSAIRPSPAQTSLVRPPPPQRPPSRYNDPPRRPIPQYQDHSPKEEEAVPKPPYRQGFRRPDLKLPKDSLPLTHETYSGYVNNQIRRTRNNTEHSFGESERSPIRPTPHTITSDTIRTSASTTTTTTAPTSATTARPDSKKVNYNYHPIIDFFKDPEVRAESRMDETFEDGWTPILEQQHPKSV